MKMGVPNDKHFIRKRYHNVNTLKIRENPDVICIDAIAMAYGLPPSSNSSSVVSFLYLLYVMEFNEYASATTYS